MTTVVLMVHVCLRRHDNDLFFLWYIYMCGAVFRVAAITNGARYIRALFYSRVSYLFGVGERYIPVLYMLYAKGTVVNVWHRGKFLRYRIPG